MNNLDNLHSYDNVEFIQGHNLSDTNLHRYFEDKMKSAENNAEFIEKEIFVKGKYSSPIDICEIGGGNGKLLYCLEQKNILNHGINYEVSKSRCDLAAKFAKLSGSSKVENRNQNFLDDTTNENEFDCIVMVDIVLQIITPLYDQAEEDTLHWIKKALKSGGYLFAELEDYSSVIKRIEEEGTIRKWDEFPESDPFQFSLQKLSVDMDKNLIDKKCFIRRDSNQRDYFKNVIHSYTKKEIVEIFAQNGFEVSIYPYYDDLYDKDEKSAIEVFRLLAKKIDCN